MTNVFVFKMLLNQAANRGTHLMLVSLHNEDLLPLFMHELNFENGVLHSS